MSARGACIGRKREFYKTVELIEEPGCAPRSPELEAALLAVILVHAQQCARGQGVRS